MKKTPNRMKFTQTRLCALLCAALWVGQPSAILALEPRTIGSDRLTKTEHHSEHEHLEIFRSGHLDLLVLYEPAEGLHLAYGRDEAGHDHQHADKPSGEDGETDAHAHDEIPLAEGEIHLSALGARTVPAEPTLAFLGTTGSWFFGLSQNEEEGLPFVGINTEELQATDFQGSIKLILEDVEGQGDVFLYSFNPFGEATLLLRSAEGGPDTLQLTTGGHFHLNWAFSAPGHYHLVFRLEATLADGSPVVSAPQEIAVSVYGHPRTFAAGHGGLALFYSPEEGLAARLVIDADHDLSHAHQEGHAAEAVEEDAHHENHLHEADFPENILMVLGGASVQQLGEEPALAFLGEPGTIFYNAPQQSTEMAPFFGFEAEGLDPLLFDGDLTIELHEHEGSGEVFLFRVGALGETNLFWNSSEAGEDVFPLTPGTHSHFNLAFTAPGLHLLHLHIQANLTAGGAVETQALLVVQAGGLQGWFGNFQPGPQNGWIQAHQGATWFWTASWPWTWNPARGWLFASGHGGHAQYFYQWDTASWIFTNPAIFPYLYSWKNQAWEIW